jgi:hypothetical protein
MHVKNQGYFAMDNVTKLSDRNPHDSFQVENWTEKQAELFKGFVRFRYRMNKMNSVLKPRWLLSICHYNFCMAACFSRTDFNRPIEKSEMQQSMLGRMSANRLNKVTDELVESGYLEVKKFGRDKRRHAYWASDKLCNAVFHYLITCWGVSYHSEEDFTYLQNVSQHLEYLFGTEEGQRIARMCEAMKSNDQL